MALLIAASAPAMAAAPASTGCLRPPPETPPATVTVDGTARRLIAVVPEGYDPARPYRLVVAFHGRTTPADRARRYYGLEDAAGNDTIFVYPQAQRQRDGTFIWRQPEDFALFDAIVDRFSRTYCIATDALFAVGHSLGATFVNDLACARGDALRAIATVAGGMVPQDCTGAVAALLLHNPDDRLVPVAEGRAARDRLLAQNALPLTPAARYPDLLDCRRYGTAAAADPVVWCPHGHDHTRQGRYYPHQWPSGTGTLIMEFFGALDRRGTASETAAGR